MILFSRALILLAVSLLLSSCESAPENSPTANPQRAAVSSIPWNKPASWEGTGALGGFMPQGGR